MSSLTYYGNVVSIQVTGEERKEAARLAAWGGQVASLVERCSKGNGRPTQAIAAGGKAQPSSFPADADDRK